MSMDYHRLQTEYTREPMFFDKRHRARLEEFIQSVEEHDEEMGMRLRMYLWRVDHIIERGDYHPHPPTRWYIRYEMMQERFRQLSNGLDRVAMNEANT